MLSIKSLVKVSVMAMSLVAVGSALAAEQQLQGVRTTLESARAQAARDYQDGTNVLVVNWSHRMVDVISPDTHQTIVLNPVGSDGNVFYIFSPYYYSSIYVEVRDHYTGRLLSHGQTNNFSTVEVTEGQGFRSTESSKAPLVVRKHKGL